MKKFVFIILLIQLQLLSAQVLRPAFPYAGQNIETEYLFRFGGPAINIQGLTNLVEVNVPNIISLYVVHGLKVQSIHPPLPVYYELGSLAAGIYTLQVFRVFENDILPIQNGTPDYSFEFQVRGAPAAVSTLSEKGLLLLVFGFILTTLGVTKLRTR